MIDAKTNEIQVGKSEEKDEIVDFANLVFSMASRPHDFETLIPKLYGQTVNRSDEHYLIRGEAGIEALLLSMQQTVDLGHVYPGLRFRRDGIGTVAVHHRARSKGLMRRLMARSIEAMQDAGVAYSFLGGQRQRYRYYGYEQAGTMMVFDLSVRNLEMTYPELRDLEILESLRLVRLADEPEHLDAAYELYLAQTALNVRPKQDYILNGSSFGHDTWLLTDEGGILALMNLSEGQGQLDELLPNLGGGLGLEAILYVLLRRLGRQSIRVNLIPGDTAEAEALQRVLGDAAEACNVKTAGMLLVLDFAKTIGMHLAARARYKTLRQGSLALRVTACPAPTPETQDVYIEVTGTRLVVRSGQELILDLALPNPAEAGVTEALPVELELDYFAAIRTLFSYRGLLEGDRLRDLPEAVGTWFPLQCLPVAADKC